MLKCIPNIFNTTVAKNINFYSHRATLIVIITGWR